MSNETYTPGAPPLTEKQQELRDRRLRAAPAAAPPSPADLATASREARMGAAQLADEPKLGVRHVYKPGPDISAHDAMWLTRPTTEALLEGVNRKVLCVDGWYVPPVLKGY